METTRHSTWIETQSLEQLRTKMWTHSNNIISNILEFTQTANLDIKEEIEKKLKADIVAFLKQKAAISSEYEAWDENWEAYHFDNREKYRQETVKLISKILKNSIDENIWEKTKNTKDILIKVLENK